MSMYCGRTIKISWYHGNKAVMMHVKLMTCTTLVYQGQISSRVKDKSYTRKKHGFTRKEGINFKIIRISHLYYYVTKDL